MNLGRAIRLVECPRDAIQGLNTFIPTEKKIQYINCLLKCGFSILDCGSFVSAPLVPQMKDTETVLNSIDYDPLTHKTELLVVIANSRGAEKALKFSKVKHVGFPLSLSETFQRKNTNKSIEEALVHIQDIHNMCKGSLYNTQLTVYLSMAFGNPYGEPCTTERVLEFVSQLHHIGVRTISFADTVGCSEPSQITEMFNAAYRTFHDIEFGAHFHTSVSAGSEKVQAAINAGCRRIDSTIGGVGGCPFAKSTLIGNVSTETVLTVLDDMGITIPAGFDRKQFIEAQRLKREICGLGINELILSQVLNNEYDFIDLCLEKFRSADIRRTGSLNKDEFCSALNAAYHELGEPIPSKEKLEESFVRADLSHDDVITFDEYVAVVRRGLRKRLHEMV